MEQNGGTKMWCPACEQVRVCRAIPAAKITGRTSDYRQRKVFTKHDDVHYFKRGRECLKCNHQFVTGEVDLTFLEELTELRDVLSDLRKNAELYSKQSTRAQKTLSKLSKSLGALKALRVS